MANQMFSTQQRVYIYDSYVLTESATQVRRRFEKRFPGVKIPSRTTIHNLYNKFLATGSVEPKKQDRRRKVLTEEMLNDISHRLEQSPRKTLRHLSQQIGISYGSVQTATKLLKLCGQQRRPVPAPPSLKLFDSVCNAPLQRDKTLDRTGASAESNVDESKMEIEDDNEQTEGGDVTDTQNPMMDLVYSLDEQTATCQQLSGVSDHQLVSVVCKLSDAGVCHMCSLLCSMSASEQSRLGSLVCRSLLLPWLRDKSGECRNRSVVKAVVEFTRTFPHLVCMEVLLPLMLFSQGDVVLEIVSEALAPEHRITLLRSFLDHEPNKIQEWQIPLIESLLSPSCGDVTRRQLVQLLSSSAHDLASNSQFAKLLVSVIKQLGPGAPPDIVQQLGTVVSANTSVLKRAAEKALNAL